MTLEEVMRFQGYDPAVLNWKASGVAKTQWGASLGDGMSLNVLRPVLKHTLRAAGLV